MASRSRSRSPRVKVDPLIKKIADRLAPFKDGGTMLENFIGFFSPPHQEVRMQDDETWQSNVDFIKQRCGDDVVISSDLPPVHSRCGLNIDSGSLSEDIDVKMKACMNAVILTVEDIQAENAGFISWKQLTKIFEHDQTMWSYQDHEEGDSKSKEEWFDEVYPKFDGSGDDSAVIKLEQLMKDTIGDQDIYDGLQIDMDLLRETFSAKGVQVGSPLELAFRQENCAHVAIDIGVVRLPRCEDPFFKLHRFRVIVFRKETAVAFMNRKTYGVYTEFHQRKYTMTRKFTEQFDAKFTQKVDDAWAKLIARLG